MIKIEIPGYENIRIKNIVFDFNGTIAEDGVLIKGVEEKIKELSLRDINIFVLTADTYGTVVKQCEELPVEVKVFNKENASVDKKNIVESLGRDLTVSVGNGRNDMEMFKSSLISIAIVGKEGCYAKAMMEADIVVTSIIDAIDLLINCNRIKATLRT